MEISVTPSPHPGVSEYHRLLVIFMQYRLCLRKPFIKGLVLAPKMRGFSPDHCGDACAGLRDSKYRSGRQAQERLLVASPLQAG